MSQRNTKYTKEEVATLLQSFYQKYKRSPTQRDHVIGKSAIGRLFGNWNSALTFAGLPLNITRHDSIFIICEQCSKTRKKLANQIADTRHNFCSQSCAATYQNTHKKTGIRRSKIEVWLENQIRTNYPKLLLICNDRKAIGAKLDFYFPTLSLAIELNSIVHYKPIYGVEKLSKIQENDACRFKMCAKHDIELCVIDISSIITFNPDRVQKHWQSLRKIIDHKLATTTILEIVFRH